MAPKVQSKSITVGAALEQARQSLRPFSDSAGLDAQVLLAEIMGRGRAWPLAHPEAKLTTEQQADFKASLTRLEAGEPLPYVIGHWEFYGLDLLVSPAVLIPRPESELLVARAIQWLEAQPGRGRVADVGSGSGCIAVALAAQSPEVRVMASDRSHAALRVAQANVKRHGLSQQVSLVQANLMAGIKGPFEVICANLPYVPSETLQKLDVYGREPSLALDGGADGLELIRRLLPEAAIKLAAGGLLLVEIETSQGEAAQGLARSAFPEAGIRVDKDLAGLDRLLVIERQMGR